MMSKYKEQFYFTCEEILTLDVNGVWEENDWYSEYFHVYLPDAPIYKTSPDGLKDYIQDLMDYVLARYRDEYIYIKDSEDITTEDKTEVAIRLTTIIMNTYSKYAPILKAYNDYANKLMDQIKSSTTSKTRFNDTPQNGGSFDNDAHATNLTNNDIEVAIDGNTPIERLNEIKQKNENIYYKWTQEFDKLFIEEANI